MSISPLQKSSKPSPVPGPSTLIATSGFVSLKISATTDEIGSTVEEPEIVIDPVRVSVAGRARVASVRRRRCRMPRPTSASASRATSTLASLRCFPSIPSSKDAYVGAMPRQRGWTADCPEDERQVNDGTTENGR